MITAAHLANILQCPLTRATKWIDELNDTMAKAEVNTPLRIAHFLAQVGHESGRLVYVREIASGRAYNGRVDLGNMRPEALAIAKARGSSPGPWWRGRGLIQLTGYDNYLACGTYLGLDLLNHPELLELPKNAAAAAGWFWSVRNNLNVFADKDFLERITKRVNGGRNGIDDRRLILMRAKTTLGIENV